MDHTSALAQRLLRLADDLQRNHEDPQLVCVRLESLYTDAIELDMHGALMRLSMPSSRHPRWGKGWGQGEDLTTSTCPRGGGLHS